MKYSAHKGKKIITNMSVIIKGQFPKYSQYLLLLDFCFRFSSVIKICKICPHFFFFSHMKENKMNC